MTESSATGGATSALRAAAIGALGGVIVATTIELRSSIPTRPASTGLLPILVCLALLCIVGLTFRRAPTAAWIAAAAAAGLAAIDVVGVARAAEQSSPPVLIVATASRAVPVLVAFGYLVSRPAGPTWLPPRVLGSVALGTTVITVGWLAAALAGGWTDARPFDSDLSRLANRVVLLDVALAIGLGAWLDVRPAWGRAQRRWNRPGVRFPWIDRARILAEELIPAAGERRRAAVEAERTRLAAELHATVLPTMRTALAAARAGSTEAAERGLGDAVDEVEQLMASREPVIVDAIGLLAGLEWLAERLQLRSGIPVEIDVETARERPPNEVERAAFRVARLALDNAGRHSGARTVRIAGIVFSDVVGLRVEDDGVGLSAAGRAARHPGRGLRDMHAEADAVQASVTVGPMDGSSSGGHPSGTSVRFEWRGR